MTGLVAILIASTALSAMLSLPASKAVVASAPRAGRAVTFTAAWGGR
jgi:hypothetical protein